MNGWSDIYGLDSASEEDEKVSVRACLGVFRDYHT